MPFLFINIAVNSKYFNTCVLLETIGSFSYFIYDILHESFMFNDPLLTSRLALPILYNIPETTIFKNYGTLYKLCTAIGLDKYAVVFCTISIASLILILILSCPSRKNEVEEEKESKVPNWLLFIRIAMIAFASLLIVYLYTAKTNPIYYSNLDSTNRIFEYNLVDYDNEYVTISQPIKFDSDKELEELKLKFYNNHEFRTNFVIVNIELWNTSTNECIFSDKIGATAIKSAKIISVPLKNTKIAQQYDYEIRLSANKGTKRYHETDNISPYVTEKIDESVGAVKVNGELQQNSLYFQIR